MRVWLQYGKMQDNDNKCLVPLRMFEHSAQQLYVQTVSLELVRQMLMYEKTSMIPIYKQK